MVPAKGGDAIPLTVEDQSSSHPRWSPDGQYLAFTSSRDKKPAQVYRLSRHGGEAMALTKTVQSVTAFEWSPDSKKLVLVLQDPTAAELAAADDDISNDEKVPPPYVIDRQQFKMDYIGYMDRRRSHLYLLDIASGQQTQLTFGDFDNEKPAWSPDGSRIAFTSNRSENADSNYNTDIWVVNAQATDPAPAPLHITTNPGADASPSWSPDGKLIAHTSITDVAASVYGTQHLAVSAADGSGSIILTADLDRMIFQPEFANDGRSILFLLAVILDIHGGPQMQYDWSWHYEAQLYAAQGWLVVHPNPHGSTGYGQPFSLGIWHDWGGPDYEDVMAGVDDAINRGWGDPDQMGVAGWSYGGILTNHVITKTDRFDAAITGASEVLYGVNYGHDQYQRWWEQELGLPWEPEAREIYERMSPFNKVDRVTTPTLILGGEEDWNVLIINSEQLYLALKRLGVDTQLIVYPGEYHGIARPSYKQDLYRRYIDWFENRLSP